MMRRRMLLPLLVTGAGRLGATTYPLTLRQLRDAVLAGIGARTEDKTLAGYVQDVTLSERLPASAIKDFAGRGAGPKTLAALSALAKASGGLKDSPDEPAIVAVPPPPERLTQAAILEKARDHALAYSERLPNFICMQVTRRWVDFTGLGFWQGKDVLAARLSYFKQREEYRVVLHNGRKVNLQPELMSGTSSRGEFGTLLWQLFSPEAEAGFKWSHWARLRGRWAYVFDFRVGPPLFSVKFHEGIREGSYTNRERRSTILSPFIGSVFVDAEDYMVRRLRREATGLPVKFEVAEASQELDYDAVPLADGSRYLLPLRAETRSRVRGYVQSRNDIEFRMYERYSAQSDIRFDLPEPLAESQTRAQ